MFARRSQWDSPSRAALSAVRRLDRTRVLCIAVRHGALTPLELPDRLVALIRSREAVRIRSGVSWLASSIVAGLSTTTS
jgi:hypothetical protein